MGKHTFRPTCPRDELIVREAEARLDSATKRMTDSLEAIVPELEQLGLDCPDDNDVESQLAWHRRHLAELELLTQRLIDDWDRVKAAAWLVNEVHRRREEAFRD